MQQQCSWQQGVAVTWHQQQGQHNPPNGNCNTSALLTLAVLL
jgi:hypothetical protein